MLCVVVAELSFFFFQAEDGIRDLVRSRGLGDVYKRQDDVPGMHGVRHRPREGHMKGEEALARAILRSADRLSLIHI